ncbi:NADH:flavin oxidoreductase/NADH oxidase [Serratia ficaria]|uniref:NADH:flavin oxidoreductase/NADH oxidase n=1 Tax=Serratia ficaria TaxID=61651 RepID=UPI00217BC687|nr:NADH:flavin oxidoreductase/NADH oxidase [Serratia ficaria]CAI0703285.1 NADPH dehydrogenase [Serratia ficaria]CAI1029545.1 NADPH dehydrogenase [Serratia ficaria]CAI1854296.1 NADPH dehydrogenase [Serratia ficaria]CAI2431896.1 NADPH dehydrogenase [Serratia ficaria]CAI2473423.1 NADPH dehydrogenase [Serratia ficaria]
MSQLFSPIALGPLTLPNRIAIAPMCQYSADNGRATEWHTIHLGHLALSGAGLLIVEASAVSPEGRITPQDLGLWDDATEQALGKVVQAVKKHATLPLGIQLAHAGRKASCAVPWKGGAQIGAASGGWQTLSASALPFAAHDETPQAMSLEQIAGLKAQFVAAARRADRLGFELIELHGAHGYLLHQFLSPLANQRSDQYGGSLQNRMRLPLEIFSEVRAAFSPGKAVGVRISASDWVEGGWDLAQSVALSKALKELGCDYIHVSSGGLSPRQKIPVGPNYQVPFAEAIKRETGLPTIAVGLITEAEQAEAIVATGQADMVALARGILYDPRWPWHAAAKLGDKVNAPPQYWRSEPHVLKGLFNNV